MRTKADRNIVVWKNEYNTYEFTKIKLPALSTFASKSKSVVPYEKFHRWVAKQFGGIPAGKVINVSASWLTKKDYEAVRELTLKWACETHKMSKKYATKQLMWLDLDISPASFHGEGGEQFESGFVYVEQSMLFKDNEAARAREEASL